jgi:hypothetical protein
VKRSIASLIERAHRHDRKVGLCGQAPSDHPAFARFLVEAGIDSMSVNPEFPDRMGNEVAAMGGFEFWRKWLFWASVFLGVFGVTVGDAGVEGFGGRG